MAYDGDIIGLRGGLVDLQFLALAFKTFLGGFEFGEQVFIDRAVVFIEREAGSDKAPQKSKGNGEDDRETNRE